MIRYVCAILALGLSISIFTTSASAIGLGLFLKGGGGTTTRDSSYFGSTTDIAPGGGLQLELNAARNEVFNDRIELGYTRLFCGDLKFDRIGLTNTFGIGPKNMIGRQARFWFGPLVGINYVHVKYTEKKYMFIIPQKNTWEGNYFQLDLGMVLMGFNFHFGKYLTMTFTFGGKAGFVIGAEEFKGYEGLSFYKTTSKTDPIGLCAEGFITIGFMIRINDSFDKSSGD